MFGGDRFEKDTDYSDYYKEIGGKLSPGIVNNTINDVLEYLGDCYPREEYHETFPSIAEAITDTTDQTLPTVNIN